jgi:hypothetical protein
MKPKFRCQDKVSDWTPFPRNATRPQRERVATFPAGHVAEVDDAGNIQIYRESGKTTDAGGVDDARPSKLRNALAELNRRNAEFYSRKDKP